MHTVYLDCGSELQPVTPDRRAAARAWLGIPPDRPLVAFVRAFGHDSRKGFDTLWPAWRSLCERSVWNADLVVAGGGRAYGLNVQEALASASPAIVSRGAGVTEHYPIELNDLLLNPDDLHDLAMRLLRWRTSVDDSSAESCHYRSLFAHGPGVTWPHKLLRAPLEITLAQSIGLEPFGIESEPGERTDTLNWKRALCARPSQFRMIQSGSMSPAIKWRMLTGEYPPQAGGVSDYSRVVARGLVAAGDTVQVYAPENPAIDPDDESVTIRRMPGHFGMRALAELSRSIGRGIHERLLIQYVPHAFGYKAMNLPFCLWLYGHTRRNGGASVIFHEVNLGFTPGNPMRYRLLDAVTKLMALLIARSAAQIFVVTPVWESRLRSYIADDQRITWVPVPSNIPVVGDRMQIAATRRRYVRACGPVAGHFGTYPPAIAAMLRSIIPRMLADDRSLTTLLIGANGDKFRESLASEYPELTTRITATSALPPAELSTAIASCDLMVQPYPDGVSSRRTSMMAALAHARAIVTTRGAFTEPLWQQSGAVVLVPEGDFDGFASAVSELIVDEVGGVVMGSPPRPCTQIASMCATRFKPYGRPHGDSDRY